VIDQAQKLREIARDAAVRPPSPLIQRVSSKRCVSIAVTSGKGGVGKTTLSLVLASSLAKLQKKVLLMDADLGLANLHILLGLAPRFNLGHLVAGECGMDDIIIEAAPGVYLAPGASGLERLANLDAGRLERLRMDFMGLEDRYDYLIMDTGAGISSAVTGFARNADLVLLVMTLDPSSLADAYAMVKVLYEKGSTNIAVAVNMAANEREGRARFDDLNKLVVKFLKKPVELYAILPNDSEILRLGRKQIHLVGQGGGNKFYGITSLLARRICGAGKIGADSGFFDRLFKGMR
jgi:flagellar biosynthesis protein FlhG